MTVFISVEGGLIPEFSISQAKEDDPNVPEERDLKYLKFGVYGFFLFNRMRPVSYTWQSDLMPDLTFGFVFDQRIFKEEDNSQNTSPLKFNSYFRALKLNPIIF